MPTPTERSTKWNREHPERRKQIIEKYVLLHPDRRTQSTKKYYHTNTSLCKLRKRNSILKKPDYYKAYSRSKYLEVKDTPEYKLQQKTYRKTHPHSNSHYPLEMRFAMNNVRLRDKNTCQWSGCGLTSNEIEIHVHHVFPKHKYPEFGLIEKYMVCYCIKHHIKFHEARGDIQAVVVLSNQLKYQEKRRMVVLK